MTKFSIVIATYNRAEVLRENLQAIAERVDDFDQFEVLVVDNDSADDTKAVTGVFQNSIPSLRYIFEPKAGVSNARNRGAEEAKADWLIFLDDDCKIRDTFCDAARRILLEDKYRFVGGIYHAWYPTGKPQWLNSHQFSNIDVMPEGNPVLPERRFASAGIVLIEKKLLVGAGMWPTELGGVGKIMRFGEENLLQRQVRKMDVPIAMSRGLAMDHLVPNYKLKMSWWIKSRFQKGRDYMLSQLSPPSIHSVLFRTMKQIKLALVALCIGTPRLVTGGYYWQNWVIDFICPWFRIAGYWVGALKSWRGRV